MKHRSLDPVNQAARFEPASACVVGCGLIGMSMAMAMKRVFPTMQIVGMDIRADHRAIAAKTGVFVRVDGDWPNNTTFDLVVLAIPANAAVEHMAEAGIRGRMVMDVCSIKSPLCDAARSFGLEQSFVPTHPMAGIAAEGPEKADGDMFREQAWILLRNWPASTAMEPLLSALGAKVVWLDDESQHDAAMAAVSHGIHVTSLSAMLAYERACGVGRQPLAQVTGPGFRDITRLADSPSQFWIDTLLANAGHVSEQLDYVKESIEEFQSALRQRDAVALRTLLERAREARHKWRQERERDV